MKNKKLSKEQLEQRKHKAEKFKLIGLVISVLINAFFIVSCSVGLASDNGNKEVAAKADEQNAFYKKNNLGSYEDLDYFNGSTGYYIASGNDLIRPSKITRQYVTDYYVSLGATMACAVRTSNDSIRSLDENWHIYYHIEKPVVDNDYIRIETPNWTRVYSVNLNSDSWSVETISPENYTYDELYLPTYLGYTAENYQRFREDISIYFNQVQYRDFQLNRNWRPTKVLQSDENVAFIKTPAFNPNLTFVNNSIYGNSYKLIDNGLFSINGALYTDLLVHCQQLSNPYTITVYNNNYTDNHNLITRDSCYFPDFVYAYNNSSERYVVIWQIPYEDLNNTYHVYSFEAGFANSQVSQIRLFNRHLGYNSVPGYTNGNILEVDGTIIASSTTINGNIGDVFGLLTSAFTGLAGLFTITILPGITIGMLLFLPLVAIIVFAIIKIIKK